MKKLLSTIVAGYVALAFVGTAAAIPANSNMGAAIQEIENPEQSNQAKEQAKQTKKPVKKQKPAVKHRKKAHKPVKKEKPAASSEAPAPVAK